MSYNFQTSTQKIEPVQAPAPLLANNQNIPFQKPAIKANNDNKAPQKGPEQKQEHSMGSLLFSAFLGGALPEVDAALDTAEFVGGIREERFQAEAKRQGNVDLDAHVGIGGAFQSGVEGSILEATPPQMRYLNEPRFAPGMKMAA